MVHTISEYQSEKESDFIMTVQLLGSGWASVLMCTVTREDGSTYPDVMETGIGRYATKAEAVIEAKQWAADCEYETQGLED